LHLTSFPTRRASDRVAAVVGVPLDPHLLDLGVVDEHLGDVVEQPVRAALDVGLVGGEVDPVEDLDLGLGDDRELLLLAAVVPGGAGLVGAVVEPVDHAVAVAIGVRAAAVLGRALVAGAAVGGVDHAVAVVVAVRAAVAVLVAVHVLRLIDAGVGRVGHAVAVA